MATIVLSWNENIEPNISAYKIYAGRASGIYTAPGSPKNMGNVLSGSFDLNADGRWFFALTVVNTSAQESAFSSEITADFLTGKSAIRP